MIGERVRREWDLAGAAAEAWAPVVDLAPVEAPVEEPVEVPGRARGAAEDQVEAEAGASGAVDGTPE